VYQEPGETFAQAWQRRVNEFGRLPIDRTYYSGLPAAWPGTAGYSGGDVVVSFKADPNQVVTGAYDATIRNWFATAPRDREIYWSYYHEPEDNIEAGQFTAATYRAAWQRVSALADQAQNPHLHATLILMCWTLEAGSHRTFADYYPGAAAVDVLGWDCYNGKWASGAYIDPSVQFAKVLATSQSTGKPFGIAEFGSNLATGDTSGTGRAAWLRTSGAWLSANHARFVAYYDSPLNGDYRLNDAPSIAAWKDCIAEY
jgi:hypothetical protein